MTENTKELSLEEINALEIGESAMRLGAGRATKEDTIDLSAGITISPRKPLLIFATFLSIYLPIIRPT